MGACIRYICPKKRAGTNNSTNFISEEDDQIKTKCQEKLIPEKTSSVNHDEIENKNNNSIIVVFISIDQQINWPIICYFSDSFKDIEQKLYHEYPELKNKYFFIVRGHSIDKSLTLEQNGIKDGDNILIVEKGEEDIDEEGEVEDDDDDKKVFVQNKILTNTGIKINNNNTIHQNNENYKIDSHKIISSSKENNSKNIKELILEESNLINIDENKRKKIKVIFKSEDPPINYSITCYNTKIFFKLEKKLIRKFPDISEEKLCFMDNENRIDKSKSLIQNNLKNNSIIKIKIIPSEEIIISFISDNQKIKYKTSCYDSDIFSIIIPEIYEKYPELKEKNVIFQVNGNTIDRSLTLEQNNIKNNSIISMSIFDRKKINVSFNSIDQRVEKLISCYDSDIFSKIEKKLYNEVSELTKEYYFLCNGIIVEKSDTFYENKIVDKNIILIVEKSEENEEEEIEESEDSFEENLKDKYEIKNTLIAVIIRTTDQEINCAISGYLDEPFSKIEEKFYLKYPKLKESNNIFLYMGSIIDKSATLRENNLKNGSIIIPISIEN